MKRIALALLLAPALVAATPVTAPQRFVRDVAHSQINFVAESRLLSAHGTFSAGMPRSCSTPRTSRRPR